MTRIPWQSIWFMKESKQSLRQQVKKLPHTADDAALCRHVVEWEWFQQAEAVMAYAAIPPEVSLQPVLEAILRQRKTLVLPRCETNGIMTARRIVDLGQLVHGTYGIPEPPETAPEFPVEEISLVLVPGLAFDRTGGRLGRGKGYYDRFLPKTTGKTIGICGQLVTEVPMEPHDSRMDAIALDSGIMLCRLEGEA